MNRASTASIRNALTHVREAVTATDLSGCDVEDIDELAARVEQELETKLPNTQTLSTYLNSIARSLRSMPQARTVVLELDAAMRESGIPTNWEH